MRTVILYPYPPQPDGLSLQGDFLYRGMKKNGEEVMPCDRNADFEKEWLYQTFNPKVTIGVGVWENIPDLVFQPQKHGIIPIPWFVANGWVANYHEVLSSLPLVFTTSDWVKRTYERDGVNTKNFVPLYIGFDTEIFRPYSKKDPKVKKIRQMLGIEDNEVMIMTAGGDATSKGSQEILKALKKVDEEFKNWKYVMKIWGGESCDDHYEDEMALIEELGESKNKVQYVEGPLSHEFMPYILSACDIYAAPSRLEGFGMIQVEAQSCGVPVISINEMGPRETIIHGETGFLAKAGEAVKLESEWAYKRMGFEEDHITEFEKPKIFAYRADIDELANYMLTLLKDRDLREKMGNRAREHVIKNMHYQVIAKKAFDIIEERLK